MLLVLPFHSFHFFLASLVSPSVDAWSVAFSPDSKYIATGSHLGKVNIFGVESGKKEYSLDTRGKFILSIAYVRLSSISHKQNMLIKIGDVWNVTYSSTSYYPEVDPSIPAEDQLHYCVGLLALIIVMDMLTSQCAAKANLQGSNIYNTCSFIFGIFHETGIRWFM